MKITKKHLIGVLFFFLLFLTYSGFILSALDASAASSLWDRQIGKTEMGRPFGEASGDARDVRVIVIYVIKVFLTFLGIIMLILMMLAGFKWMTSGGNDDKVKEAKSMIKSAIIGFIIIILSHLLVMYIGECVLDIATGAESWLCNPNSYE
ncbi:hypothetical protein DRH27_02305 [Candidatus Falkowbacteria bacterium]|nr:MAG: hypothetical protein DRH27_02305 [Candidatus Falkowbacteria bacterium]